MIDSDLVICGSFEKDGTMRWEQEVFLNPSGIASIVHNAIDLSNFRDISVGSDIFLNFLMKSSSYPSATPITIEIRGARDSSLLDWSIISTSKTESFSSALSRGFVSIPLNVCADKYRYLFSRIFLENVPAMSFELFGYFSNVPLLENKIYPSGWGIA